MKKLLSNIFSLLLLALLTASCNDAAKEAVSSAPGSGSGQAGSMARFGIAGDYLYVIDDQSLKLIDISTPSSPRYIKNIQIGFGIETIFPYNNMLFIGANNGMYIYDISNPDAPALLSTYFHITACDPVVVQGNYAYVTLRNGTPCNTAPNQLEVIDISNPRNPQRIATYTMQHPHGLDIDGDNLFVCEGQNGFKVMNAANPYNVRLVKNLTGMNAYDVIALANTQRLLMIGDDGFYQYDYTNPENMKLLSKIAVNK